jgi:hypothetical protein
MTRGGSWPVIAAGRVVVIMRTIAFHSDAAKMRQTARKTQTPATHKYKHELKCFHTLHLSLRRVYYHICT